MGFSGMNTAVSGLRAAQAGLGVTGHNMSNSETRGYSRQRIVQKEYYYNKIGYAGNGTPLRVGLGTDWNAISQIRNEFLDYSYRKANAKLSFYSVKATVGTEIEANLGELQGADNFQSVIQELWYSIEELTAHPQGVATREYFLATCGSFVTKANEVYDSLLKYQKNLDGQIRGAVDDINVTVSGIKELNTLIRINEVAGDNANDYRDQRNLLMDRLSELIPASYSYNDEGEVTIFSDSHMILCNNEQNFFGLRYTAENQGLVEPILVGGSPKERILEADTPPSDFEQYINYDKPINSERNNDYGILKGLVVARGAVPVFWMGKDGLKQPMDRPASIKAVPAGDPLGATFATWFAAGTGGTRTDAEIAEKLKDFDGDGDPATNSIVYIDPAALGAANYDRVKTVQKTLTRQYQAEAYNYKQQAWSVDNCMIPKTMMKLDQVFHSIVTMLNDTVAPAAGDPVDPDNEITPNNNNNFVGPQERDGYDYADYIQNPNAPFDNDHKEPKRSYEEIFVRGTGPDVTVDRWLTSYDDDNDPSTPNVVAKPPVLNPEFKGDYYSQYSIGNVKLNPALTEVDGGYNEIALSYEGDIEDTRLLNDLQQLWKSTSSEYAVELGGVDFNMDESYNKLVTQLGTEVQEAKSFVDGQTVQVERAEYKRQTIMGVSMDEELNNMMKYQYAYQAAARIVNVIDSMIDKVVNGTGRVGL